MTETMKRPPKRSFFACHYSGLRTLNGCQVTRHNRDRVEPLHWRLDLWNHSPTGLEWGYGGSGPAQLALALLADALADDDSAVCLYQWFKRDVTARLPHDEWLIHAKDIADWVDRHKEELSALEEEKEHYDNIVLAEYDTDADTPLSVEYPHEARVSVVDDSGQIICRDVPESYGLYVAAQNLGWNVVKRLDT